LRDAVEELGGDTRAPAAVPGADGADAIGDLARSVAGLAARQREHAAYLEQVGRRLSHEMRTPVGVVRSSLDNLRLSALPGDARVYLDRADEGLRRLSLILSRMTEATRLEQSLAATEREAYDLVPVARGCVDAYRAANPGREIALREPGEALRVVGSPDLLAQLLDKLVDNALGFARPGTPVEVDLHRYGRTAALSVRNEGPRLPAEMEGRLFESMVSIRPAGGSGHPPHLGLGLYVVRLIAEFHGGSAAAHDRPDGRGVIVTVTLPLAAAGGVT
jgi:signal transduction histidine kinase